LLDLVAIGTVADCQSLLGENRIFVKWGLHVMGKTRWPGLRELMDVAGIVEGSLDTYSIGFIIAPRINAAGRIEHANLALELLLTDAQAKAGELAKKLDNLNRKRQDLTQTILSEAREQLATTPEYKILLAAGDNWPKGIVGLVAGRLTEEFSRPVLVLDRGAEEATGSARSIGNFNIIEAISRSQEILIKYGGHPMAAGFTLRSEHIETFHKNLLEYAEEALADEDLNPVLFYDAEIEPREISEELVDFLERLAPFGLGNPRPRFRINNLTPQNPMKIGVEGRHLRMYVESFGCIGFNQGFWADKFSSGGKIDLICEPQYNEWNGEKKIQLKIIDIDLTQ
jgi:single-stranded-DNA-specific exonuclease